ncbi:oxidoreductase [Natrinema saccharevitans]|uniref:Oxidoreductase n=1 Tax=Natrinema saccharevitans TaxID=301967 RepID=A0A1S8AV69_9EURY|nr:Gfo/Idh/MocA family oxidoreductase [Natrinema saccharevitans]OLZ40419.1 oxidoreductase [Natrinema saccharevitans]
MTVRTAVVGAGTVSEVHLSGLEKNPRTDLVAICDVDLDRANEAATAYDITPYSDLEDLLARESLDWLHVCTPVQTHLEIARTAIEAGIPVLIEKPVTETVAELEELQRLSDRHGVPVSPVHQHLFDPAMRTARRLIRSGNVGPIHGVDVIYTGLTPPDAAKRGTWVFDLPGGEFEEGLPHPIYSGLAVGGFPKSTDDISANTRLAGEYEDDFAYDTAQLQYESADGALCTLKMLSGSKPRHEILIHGEGVSMRLDLILQSVETIEDEYHLSSVDKGKQAISRSANHLTDLAANLRLVADAQLNDDWETATRMNPHYAQFDRTARALEADGPMPVSLESSKWTITLLEALRDAATPESLRATPS